MNSAEMTGARTATPAAAAIEASIGVPGQDAFADLDRYASLPRMSGLVMSPDGSTLVVSVSTPDVKGRRYVSSLWRIDPTGREPATRLTNSAQGESSAAFTAAGDLLFASRRADPRAAEPDEDSSPLWLLPRAGGESRVLATRAGGFGAVKAARNADLMLVTAPVLPAGADSAAADDALRKARKDAAVTAILHDGYPVRFWDHDLGPDQPHLLVGSLGRSGLPADGFGVQTLRDLTPAAGAALIETDADVSADGSLVVTSWRRPLPGADQIVELALIDVASGERSTLVADPAADLSSPRFSPDGSRVAFIREQRSTPDSAPVLSTWIVGVQDKVVTAVAPGWDRWPNEIIWSASGSGLLISADEDGRGPVFLAPLDGGQVRRLTDDDACYTDLVASPDGGYVYALRTGYAWPPHPVRIALSGSVGSVELLPAPAPPPELPGSLVDVRSTAGDGTPVRGWLALPPGAGPEHPAPLLLWIHGGPLNSWNAWSWRWNPWLMVAAGYAVLLPDPALSTGYGQAFVQRGWGSWGGAPYADLLAITEEVEKRPDIDASRTAAMGGSFGGYMANWVAGHTDRFKAIVTHASLWCLDDFGPTTDGAYYWRREMTPEMTAQNSPHRFVGEITTPMLVIHGDKDYRVPIGQGVRLWYDLLAHSGLPADGEGHSHTGFSTTPRRTTGCSRRAMAKFGTGWCSTSSPSTSWANRPLRFRNSSAARPPHHRRNHPTSRPVDRPGDCPGDRPGDRLRPLLRRRPEKWRPNCTRCGSNCAAGPGSSWVGISRTPPRPARWPTDGSRSSGTSRSDCTKPCPARAS